MRSVITDEHDRLRILFERRHRNTFYYPGDKVWIKTLPKDHVKLDPLWYGPCETLEHLQLGRYRVQTPKGVEILHADSFKPYRPDLEGRSIPFHY